MFTMRSTLREVYRHPVGKDILDMLFYSMRKNPKLLDNPAVGSLRLSMLNRLLGRMAPGLAETIVNLLATHPETPPAPPPAIRRAWWKQAVVYQIYPRSFMDSNGDGIGDLAGIRQKIPYLKRLGVNMVWLSPIYDSPNDDCGYDIRNYKKIMKEFGNMQSFNALIAELHKHDIKLMMDLVVNHTSDEHAWFKKALADPTCPEKDYYIWANGRGEDTPPNNWISFFSGPAWNYYPQNSEWALHLFSKKQMDLNWNNPAVRGEVYDIIRWWLNKGVDGFRMDVINLISKDSLADGNETIGGAIGLRGIEHYFYGPKLHDYLKEMRQQAFSAHSGALTVGETPGMGLEMSRMLTAEERGELDMVFTFDHLDNPGKSRKAEYKYDLRYLKPYFIKWQTQYGNSCWPTLFFENHDNPRMPSKVSNSPAMRPIISKLLAVLQFTLKGTPFIYQGQELGMTNTVFSSINDVRDVETLGRYEELLEKLSSNGADYREFAFKSATWGSRDHARTPMQWDDTQNAGFSSAEPWLGVNPNYPQINAKNQIETPSSVFNFFRKLILLRTENEVLVYGKFSPVFLNDKNSFCYFRTMGGQKFYVEVNLCRDEIRRPGPLTAEHKLVAGNYGGTTSVLRPYEANVYQLS